MKILRDLLAFSLATLAGIFSVQALVADPVYMNIFTGLALGCGLLLVVTTPLMFQRKQAISRFALALLAFLCGYTLMTGLFLGQEEVRAISNITRAEGQKGDGHTAVVYFTHGEPPTYNPMPWIETVREFDANKATFVPWIARPFFFNGVRSEYLRMGSSPHNQEHARMVANLQTGLPQDMPVYLAFLDSNPRPDEALVQAINAGADRIILMPVFVTVSSHTQAGEELVAAMQPEKYGITVCQASPLWDSDLLKQSYVQRTNAARGSTEREKVGVLLVGHGQPAAWDAIYPTQTEQENLYRESIKDFLVRDGYQAENIVLSWMEFKTPVIEDGLHELAANGVEKIIVFSTSISAKSIHSDIQVPDAIHEAKLPESIEVIDLGSFGDPDNPQVLAAIREKIAVCAPELQK